MSDSGPDKAQTYGVLTGLLAGHGLPHRCSQAIRWDELVELAEAEGVSPLLDRTLHGLSAVEVPADAREALGVAYREAGYVSLLQESVRSRFCSSLHQRQIPALLLKGAALAYTCYDDPATRPMGDLDLLIDRSRLEEAAGCAEQHGFRPLWGSLARELQRSRGHLVYTHPSTGAILELHWELQVLGRAQARALPEIWAGAQPVDGLGNARRMRWGHAVPLLCAHLILQHQEARLLWLYDLHRVLMCMEAAEASVAIDSATRWGLAACTACTLIHVHELFGTSLPGDLYAWATRMAANSSLQARVAARVLGKETGSLPVADLLDLAIGRDWSLLGTWFPSPRVLRERLELAPDQSILPVYRALLSRRLRTGPSRLWSLWRFYRASSRPRSSGRE
jgi:hypothetical protein